MATKTELENAKLILLDQSLRVIGKAGPEAVLRAFMVTSVALYASHRFGGVRSDDIWAEIRSEMQKIGMDDILRALAMTTPED
jgi:hypothetical protein